MMVWEKIIAFFGVIGLIISLVTADAPFGFFDIIGLLALVGSDYVPGFARYPVKIIGAAIVIIISIIVIIIALALILGISLVLGGSI